MRGNRSCICFTHSFSFICSLMFVTFSGCFQVLFSEMVGWEGGGVLLFFLSVFHKLVFWNLLGISEAQLILHEGWLFLSCTAALQPSNSNSSVLAFPSKWVAGCFPAQIQCVPREAPITTSTADLCLCPPRSLPTAARDSHPCGATALLPTRPPTCRGITPLQVFLEPCIPGALLCCLCPPAPCLRLAQALQPARAEAGKGH